MILRRSAVDRTLWVIIISAGLMGSRPALAQETVQETVLYSFTGAGGGGPAYGVIRDSSGNLYGVAGGGYAGSPYSCGVVYKLDTSGHETVLSGFNCDSQGLGWPSSGVIRDSAGTLYGITTDGGSSGTVYQLDSDGDETVLYRFNFPGTVCPCAGVIRDSSGNLYGTTAAGGTYGQGVVYKLDATGQEAELYNFTGGTDGDDPSSGVILDSAGNLYGTTAGGGTYGQGVVYKLDATGHEAALYNFTGGTDGGDPLSGVIRDPAGNLYGTTNGGGSSNYGTVYKVDINGKETPLYSFKGGSDGGHPNSGVVGDSAGNLYGIASDNVYKVDITGKEVVLYSFTGGADGACPCAGVVLDSAGNLYGTTLNGGTVGCGIAKMNDCGVIFEINATQTVQTGTIVVTTDLAAATFTVTGPATFSGSGTSATFNNAPAGTYTVTFGAKAEYTAPSPQTQTLVAGGTARFNGRYTASPITLTSITGWTAGNVVIDAEWTGQPTSAPNHGRYYLFYDIDACQSSSPCSGFGATGPQEIMLNPVWHFNGSGFCPQGGCAGEKGSLSFSDPAINPVSAAQIRSWTDTEITFTPSFVFPSYQYTNNPDVSATITRTDGTVATLSLPTSSSGPASPGTIATIDGRGYGQCTWYVANQRLAQGLSIPAPAYYNLDSIDGDYAPEQWDVLDFFVPTSTGPEPLHTAIIISPVISKQVSNSDGSATITYIFTIGEMNAGTCPPQGGQCTVSPWSEQASTVKSEFVVLVSANGTRSVETPIYSLDTAHSCTGPHNTHLCSATNYFR